MFGIDRKSKNGGILLKKISRFVVTSLFYKKQYARACKASKVK